MKNLLSLVLFFGFIGLTVASDKVISKYYEPSKADKVVFKDGSFGYRLVYKIDVKDFENGKIPERYSLVFVGYPPAQIDVIAQKQAGDKSGPNQEQFLHYGENGYYTNRQGNLYNANLIVTAIIVESPDKVENWQKSKLKFIGSFYEVESKKFILFMTEAMKIKGVVGVGKEGADIIVDVAKTYPKLDVTKKELEECAKRNDLKIAKIVEREGSWTWDE